MDANAKILALSNWGVEVPEKLNHKQINRLYKVHYGRNKKMWDNLAKWGVIPSDVNSMRDIFKIWNIEYSSPRHNHEIVKEIYKRESKIESIKRYLQKTDASIPEEVSLPELQKLKTIEKKKTDLIKWGVQLNGTENDNEIQNRHVYESRKNHLKKWGIEIHNDLSFDEIEEGYLCEKYKRKLVNWNIALTGDEDTKKIKELYFTEKKKRKNLGTKKKQKSHLDIPYKNIDAPYHEANFDDLEFKPNNIRDTRDRISASIVRRNGQSIFRKRLLKIYKNKCAITGSDAEQALEAAHIMQYKGEDTNHPSNGILLRSDIHTLFDLGLISIDTSQMTVLISPALMNTTYKKYAGKSLYLPENKTEMPNKDALDIHRRNSGL